MKRIGVIAVRWFLLGLVLAAGAASAQQYPDKSKAIKMIVPTGPASAVDLLARALARAIADEAGLNVIIDNKPGAENVIGVQALVSSPPDGYTLFANSNSSQSLNPVLIPDLRYDPLKDMQPVATMSKTGLIMNLGAGTPFKSAREFVEAAKKAPGKYTCATATTTKRMACEMLQARAGIKLLVIPYKATAAAMIALSSGEADTIFVDAGTAQGQWQSGRVRGVAVTLPERMKALPQLPTLREEGVANFNMTAWYAVYAPEKTPAAVAAAFREIVRKATKSKGFSDTLTQFAMEPLDLSPDEVKELIRREIHMWTDVVREQNIKVGG
jgi:tripartite-type tricarboxylate transporter receptor subunit TctC